MLKEPKTMNYLTTRTSTTESRLAASLTLLKHGTSGMRINWEDNPIEVEILATAYIQFLGLKAGDTIALGGDGRSPNDEILSRIIPVFLSNQINVKLAVSGVAQTPVFAYFVERYCDFGLGLTPSHNPFPDVGFKPYGPEGSILASDKTQAIDQLFHGLDTHTEIETSIMIDFSGTGNLTGGNDVYVDATAPADYEFSVDGATVTLEVVDPFTEYFEFIATIVGTDSKGRGLKEVLQEYTSTKSILIDNLHTYGIVLWERLCQWAELRDEAFQYLRGDADPKFKGMAPEPSVHNFKALRERLLQDRGLSLLLGFETDADGDRGQAAFYHPDGKTCFLSANDFPGLVAANREHIHGLDINSLATSFPTSRSTQRVCKRLGLEHTVTSTGWKNFAVTSAQIAGEESQGFGTEKEKSGVLALMFLVTIAHRSGKDIYELLHQHFGTFGRDYFTRLDLFVEDASIAQAWFEQLQNTVHVNVCEALDRLTITDAGVHSSGVWLITNNGGRIVFRLSGTGTGGATIRCYMERYSTKDQNHWLSPINILTEVEGAALQLLAGLDYGQPERSY